MDSAKTALRGENAMLSAPFETNPNNFATTVPGKNH